MSIVNDPPFSSLCRATWFCGVEAAVRRFPAAGRCREMTKSLDQQVQAYLCKRLAELPAELGLAQRDHFLCGISQIAAGADTLFTRACQSLNLPQRIFSCRNPGMLTWRPLEPTALPTSAPPSGQQPCVLSSPHVIQEQVVSDGPDRRTRFEDSNRELLRAATLSFACCGPTRPASPAARPTCWNWQRPAALPCWRSASPCGMDSLASKSTA